MQGEHPGDPDPGEDKGGRMSLPLPFPHQKVGVKAVVAADKGHHRDGVDEPKGRAVKKGRGSLSRDSHETFPWRILLCHGSSSLRKEDHQ